MGNDEVVASTKPEKVTSPMLEQPVVHPYPDWAAMQAYYGSGVHMPPPYFTTVVGHPPNPYMWGPQPFMPPFGPPYTAIYPHGVYSHPSVSLVASPSATDVLAKMSNGKDTGLMKKLKGFDGLAVSIGNVNTEITVGDGSGQSQSGDNGADGSSDESDENNESGVLELHNNTCLCPVGKDNQGKRSSGNIPTSGDRKAGAVVNEVNGGKTSAPPNMSVGVAVSPPSAVCIPMCTMAASSLLSENEFKPSTTTQQKAGGHPEHWSQDEKELKKEKRKQSNRESARRSRLRKQAETEELATKVENLVAENATLRSEINQLKEDSQKLRAENSLLMGRMNNIHYVSANTSENEEPPTVVVENFLSRIDGQMRDENHEVHDSSNGGKLRQLLDPSPRTDAVAAG